MTTIPNGDVNYNEYFLRVGLVMRATVSHIEEDQFDSRGFRVRFLALKWAMDSHADRLYAHNIKDN